MKNQANSRQIILETQKELKENYNFLISERELSMTLTCLKRAILKLLSENEKVSLHGIVTFSKVRRKGREIHDVSSGSKRTIPEKDVVIAKTGKSIRGMSRRG